MEVRAARPSERSAIEAALASANALGSAAVFLEGDPTYYGKRGFVSAVPLGLLRPSRRIPEPGFQVATLSRHEKWMTGQVVYPESMWDTVSVGLRDPQLATIEDHLQTDGPS